jgi:sec-independent protein translocase protein TatC
VISAATLVVAFSFCFWQNNAILDIVTKPVRDTQNLQNPSTSSKDPLEQAARFQQEQGQALRALAPALSSSSKTFDALGAATNLTAAQRASIATSSRQLAAAGRQVAEAAQAIPRNTQRNLVTLGVTEPFTATITIAFYASLLLAMPMLLFQAYAFVLPAFSPGERKVALPLMLMVPVLFVAGAAFGYFVVLERAVQFLQNFNDDSFDILLQARTTSSSRCCSSPASACCSRSRSACSRSRAWASSRRASSRRTAATSSSPSRSSRPSRRRPPIRSR